MRIITCFLIDCEFDTNYLTKHQHKIYFWILARRPSVGRNLMNYAKNSKSIGVQKPHNHSCKNWNLAEEFSLHLRSIFLTFFLNCLKTACTFVDTYLFLQRSDNLLLLFLNSWYHFMMPQTTSSSNHNTNNFQKICKNSFIVPQVQLSNLPMYLVLYEKRKESKSLNKIGKF